MYFINEKNFKIFNFKIKKICGKMINFKKKVLRATLI